MGHRTPLFEAHLAAGATMVDFSGWDMPVHYGSQIAEHHAVRRDAGMFDVSHMRPVDIRGPGASAFLRRVLANDVAKLAPQRALYSCMCNEHGGVVDDVIVYRGGEGFRMVVNCATTAKDLAWLQRHAGDQVVLEPRSDLAIIAVQGPNARSKAAASLGLPLMDLPRFGCLTLDGVFVGRTGYTGEDGVEIILAADRAVAAWDALRAAGVQPAGLGARDTLRLEAGLNLYGNDMDEDVTPMQCGLRWTVDFGDPGRDFIGRAALAVQQVDTRFVGLQLSQRAIMRAGQRVRTEHGEGVITSGTFSPTLGRSIAMARIPVEPDLVAEVDVRGRWLAADIVDLPFVRPQRGGAS